MEHTTVTSQLPVPAVKRKASVPDPEILEPSRGGEPRSIGQVMQPLQAIIDHPNRNRLLAQFCRKIGF